ncbi:MAG: hypothetical protein NWR08_11125 [Opitutales bacterium]|jgi:hypothetical protein|nr:hypothetical protein [Opitutales bacterium]
MKYLTLLLIAFCTAQAYEVTEWEKRREDGTADSRDYTRNGKVIMTQHVELTADIDHDGYVGTVRSIVRTKTKENEDTWIISIASKEGKFSGLTTGPEIKNFELYIADQNQDGEIDLITLMNQDDEIFEMFTFSKGYLEPVPEELIEEVRKDSTTGEPKLITLINQR